MKVPRQDSSGTKTPIRGESQERLLTDTANALEALQDTYPDLLQIAHINIKAYESNQNQVVAKPNPAPTARIEHGSGSVASSDQRLGIWEVDLQNGSEFWSRDCFAILGEKSFNGTLLEFQALLEAEDAKRLMELIAVSIEERTTFRSELRITESQANCRRVFCRGECEYDTNHQPRRILGVLQAQINSDSHPSLSRSTESGLRMTIDNLLEGCQILDADLRYVYLNSNALLHWRRTAEELIGHRVVDAIPGFETTEIYARIQQCISTQEVSELQSELVFPDGSIGVFDLRILPSPDGVVILTNELTQRIHAEAMREKQGSVLEQIAIGVPLPTIFQTLVDLTEGQFPGSFCSIYLVDEKTNRLRFTAGHNLPPDYVQEVLSIPIGPQVGSCGTAAHLGKTVVVSNIATDPLWTNYRHLAEIAGFQSCWSSPILAKKTHESNSNKIGGKVLGTFAVYRRDSSVPDAAAETLLATPIHLARVALERDASIKAIRESEARYSTISEITRSVTFALRLASNGLTAIEWAYPRFGLLTGHTEEDYKTNGWESVFYPEDRPRLNRLLKKILDGQTGRDEIRLVTKSGKILLVLVQGKLVESESKTDLGLIIGGMVDVTELKMTQLARFASEERFRLALRGANDGLWDWNLETNQIFFSPRWKSMLGYQEIELVDRMQTWMRLLHPDDKPILKTQLREFLSGPTDKFESEFRMRHRSDEYLNILCRGFLVRNSEGRPVRMVGTHQDITDRKKADEELRLGRQRLESLSRQLITTREAELRHLARELHDEIGQELTAMKMNIRDIQRTADEKIRARLEENLSMIDSTVNQVRNLSLNMRPPHLDDLGLVATLHWYLSQQAKLAGFEEKLSVDPPDLQIPNDLAIVCFRITQEAVTNAMRHANPKTIQIDLRQSAEGLHLTIHDDGRGFDVAAARKRASNGSSLGIIGMQERASLAGGHSEIESNLDQGTKIHVWFPHEKTV